MDVYDFKKVSLIIDGHYVSGWMDGSVLSVAKNADNTIPHVGADGSVTFSNSNDKTQTITATIKQSSASLPVIVALAKGKKEFPAQIVDANTNAVRAGGTQCRILKEPDINWGAEISGVEIQIFVADGDLVTA